MEDKENIFTKFINFIKRIFGNKEPKQIPENIEVLKKQKSKQSFSEELKVNQEDPTLLKLQSQYEKGEISLSEMSDEQIHNLNELYKKQVSELKNKLNEKKAELSMMQNKIKKN